MPTDWTLAPDTAETHISVLIFVGDRAYKLHKPLRNAFLDHSTRGLRERACREEVELNRRFSPDVYLGVVDLMSEDGIPKDHLVAMQRLPAERQLTRLLDDRVASDQLAQVARTIADAHRAHPAVREHGLGDWTQLRQLWHAGATQLSRFADQIFPASLLVESTRLARRYLGSRRTLFDLRVEDGRVRDGHGDLLADDIYCMPDGPRILDCLAFDRALRVSDVLSDAAFLAMDVSSHGHTELADGFLSEFAAQSDDRFPPSLAYHYLAYRAFVRAKIACLAAEQCRPGKAERAVRLLHLALSYLQSGRVRMVMVGGPPGSGKSTLAAKLGERCGFAVVRSDVTRKERVGQARGGAPASGFREGLYTPDITRRVHDAMLERAKELLQRGQSVILDASWSDGRQRMLARRVAAAARADLTEVRCAVDDAEADRRIRVRLASGGDASDATPEIAARMRESFAPWPSAITIDTTDPPERCASTIASELGLELPQPLWISRAPDAVSSND